MSGIDGDIISLYKTLTEPQKKCVRIVIAGMKLSKKDPENLIEKGYVRAFIQAMRTVRKKTAEPALKTVNQ